MVEIHIIERFINENKEKLKDNRIFPMLITLRDQINNLMPYLCLSAKKFRSVMPDSLTQMQILREVEDHKETCAQYIEYFSQILFIDDEKFDIEKQRNLNKDWDEDVDFENSRDVTIIKADIESDESDTEIMNCMSTPLPLSESESDGYEEELKYEYDGEDITEEESEGESDY